jgi:hypothetical protein
MSDEVVHYEHARDISDLDFLAAVRRAGIRTDGTGWAVVSEVVGVLGDGVRDADGNMPGVPHKVVIAKAKRLIGRGLLEGCICGCRGDFELTAAGMQLLDTPVIDAVG